MILIIIYIYIYIYIKRKSHIKILVNNAESSLLILGCEDIKWLHQTRISNNIETSFVMKFLVKPFKRLEDNIRIWSKLDSQIAWNYIHTSFQTSEMIHNLQQEWFFMKQIFSKYTLWFYFIEILSSSIYTYMYKKEFIIWIVIILYLYTYL